VRSRSKTPTSWNGQAADGTRSTTVGNSTRRLRTRPLGISAVGHCEHLDHTASIGTGARTVVKVLAVGGRSARTVVSVLAAAVHDAARDLADIVGSQLAEPFIYPGDRHLFTDSSLPSYDADAAALVVKRSGEFLDRVGSGDEDAERMAGEIRKDVERLVRVVRPVQQQLRSERLGPRPLPLQLLET